MHVQIPATTRLLKALAGFLALTLLLTGCNSMKPEDFENKEPRLVLEAYFLGETRAWGIFEDRFGNLRRQFVVDVEGSWDGETLVLDERFRYADGETDRRVWRLRKIDEHRWEGTADDVQGTGVAEVYGNALNLRYTLALDVGGRTWNVNFDDWMYLMDDGVIINRARVSKLGIELGQATIFFKKPDSSVADTERPQEAAQ
ncbi:DUF3833 domain-containing protein [Fodinicurvata fenggangensis]|uniref:DUF3833 domain-containing protein n=1 Tax=Fodinicurvata fenggangensis TaxID=1121830 RepID=UPI0009DF82BB|nr:DUF3833 domain-containing protein [Fodinicurvata fenggangensis]